MLQLSRRLFKSFVSSKKNQKARRQPQAARLRLETLEDRLVPAHNITIQTGGTTLLSNPGLSSFSDTNNYTIDPSQFTAATANVLLRANTDIIFLNSVSMPSGLSLTAAAGRNVTIEANVATSNAALNLKADDALADGVTVLNRDIGSAMLSTNTTLNPTVTLSSGGGAITLTGDIGNGIGSGGTIKLTGGVVQAGAGNIVLAGDVVTLGSANSINGTGSVTVQPATSSRPIQIGGISNAFLFVFTQADRLALADGFQQITLGGSNIGGNITTGGNLTPFTSNLSIVNKADPVQGNITITNTIDDSTKNLAIKAGNMLTVGTGGQVLSSGSIDLEGNGSPSSVHIIGININGGIVNGEGGSITTGGQVTVTNGSPEVFLEVQNNGEIITSGTGSISLATSIPAGSGNIGVLVTSGGRITAGGGDPSKSFALNSGSVLSGVLNSSLSTSGAFQFVHVDGTADLGGARINAVTSGNSSCRDHICLAATNGLGSGDRYLLESAGRQLYYAQFLSELGNVSS